MKITKIRDENNNKRNIFVYGSLHWNMSNITEDFTFIYKNEEKSLNYFLRHNGCTNGVEFLFVGCLVLF